MKHFLSSLIAFMLLSCSVFSQTQEVQKVEFEARAGMTIPLGSFYGGKAGPGPMLGLELRHNFKNSPWDCGVLLQINSGEWCFTENGSRHWQNNRILTFAVVGDYNFRQGKRVNPFAGFALGAAGTDSFTGNVTGPKGGYIDTEGAVIAFMPRVGVELMRHIRVTCAANISRKGFHMFDLTLGVAIGGRPKKQK